MKVLDKRPKDRSGSRNLQDRVLAVIRQHVGLPCPTNLEIAEMLNVDRCTVSSAICSLYKRGIVKRDGTQKLRILTIVKENLSTEQSNPPKEEHFTYEMIPHRFERAAPLPDGIIFDDVDPDALDDRGREYLKFDASRIWPATWPRLPNAVKTDYIPERFRLIASQAE